MKWPWSKLPVCVDCRWHRDDDGSSYDDQHQCTHPKVNARPFDPVVGQRPPYESMCCKIARAWRCDEAGKYWEPKA